MFFPSEARRVNGSVKTRKQFGEGLHHLLNERGAKSDLFPQTVNQLLDFDGRPNVSPFACL